MKQDVKRSLDEGEIQKLISEMRVVILAAGGATRMRPLSKVITKPMLPVGKEPLMGKILNNFYDIGLRHFVIVYGKQEERIVPYVKDLEQRFQIKISLVKQSKPIGMADAILLTKEHVISGTDQNLPFFVTAGDVYFPPESLKQTLLTHLAKNANITLPVVHSTDTQMAVGYGNLKIVDDIVEAIVEKPGPDKKIDDYYSMPIYIFNEQFFEWLDKVEVSARGEKELQDAIQMVINVDGIVAGKNLLTESIHIPQDGEYHITYPRDFLAINFRELRENTVPEEILSIIAENGALKGPIGGNIVRPKEGTQIGPNVFIGENTDIGTNCTIQNSYLFSEVLIGDGSVLSECIVEKGVKIHAGSKYDQKIILAKGIFDL